MWILGLKGIIETNLSTTKFRKEENKPRFISFG